MITGLYLKLGIAAVLFVAGVGAGCQWQAKRDRGKLEAADKEIAHQRAQVAILGATLAAIDADTVKAQAAADARLKAAQAAGRAAEKGEVIYRDRLVYVDREIATAAKAPGCQAQLETRLCAPLH